MQDHAGLKVAPELAAFLEARVLAPLGIAAGDWWPGVAAIFDRFAPANRALLAKWTRLRRRARAGVRGNRSAQRLYRAVAPCVSGARQGKWLK